MTARLSDAPLSDFRVPETVPRRVDWDAEKGRIDLAGVITREIGPPKVMIGRPWWKCPFHEDRKPSLIARTLSDGRQRWKCYGCGSRDDVAAFIMMLKSSTFPEAVAYLTGGAVPSGKAKPARIAAKPKAPKEPQPEGWADAALAAVESAEARLWTPEGAEALGYLHGRGLTEATVRAARLGFVRVRQTGIPSGVTVPWFDGDRLSMVNVRRPAGSDPKYMLFTGSRRGGIYPGPGAVKPGVPLVIVEGEFDALLLGQVLAGLASVVTLGCAGDRADRRVLDAILPASPWFAANDADAAGDNSAAPWLAYDRCRRVRPPGPYKDWTEAAAAGVNLRRWWEEILAGEASPKLFTWEELSAWRWGPATGEPAPGVVIDRPNLVPQETGDPTR